MAMIVIGGVPIRDPSGFTWGLQDISDSAAGRTQDSLMHKNRVGQKRKLSLEWSNISPEEASKILKAVNPEYFNVRYPDALNGVDETRTFYVGDRTAPMRSWYINKKRYNKVSFDLIER